MIAILEGAAAEERVRRLADRMAELPADAQPAVDRILADVRARGDAAVQELTKKHDGVDVAPHQLRVTADEFEAAYAQVDLEFLKAFERASSNIERFHRSQVERSWVEHQEDGCLLGIKVTPIAAVGAYVPGGTAGTTPLISTAMMTAIPARVAGVPRIAVATPPNRAGGVDPHLLVTLDRLGVREIYKMGGAQAIAALAYGTATVPAVHKIVGPGNVYVALAKRAVFGRVDIDAVAGPSEILVLADSSAKPEWVAADLIAQAEHDPLALAILVTTERKLADEVSAAIVRRLEGLPRADIARRALAAQGVALVFGDLDAAVAASNAIAPEHLEIVTEDPHAVLGRITAAGAIFLGGWTPMALGDYVAGPNHTLPTSGTARHASPLGVWDFIKRSTVTSYTRAGLERVARAVDLLAHLEGLDAHAESVSVRLPPRRPR